MTTLELRFVEILAVLLALWGGVQWERHKGATACLQADAKAVATQTIHAAQTTAAATVEVAKEKVDLHDETIAPVSAPVVRLCVYPYEARAVPKASPAGPVPDDAASERNPVAAGPDIGKPVVTIGRNADSQIRALQAYITRVCEASP